MSLSATNHMGAAVMKSLSSRLSSSSSTAAASSIADPVQRALMSEQCILVDRRDRPVGQASKEDCHLLNSHGTSPLHRAFSLFLFSERNELLMQQRSQHKVTFPGLWSNTCCSHPLANPREQEEAGDAVGVKRAAQRKLQQELGIPPTECPVEEMTFLCRILYFAPCSSRWGEHEMDYILFLRMPPGTSASVVRPNPNEVSDVRFLRRGELADFVAAGGVTPWFRLVSGELLPRWWEAMEQGRLEEGVPDRGRIVDFTGADNENKK